MDNPDKHIQTLATNISDMMVAITAIHGEEYATKLAAMFALCEQVAELERICCSATIFIHDTTTEPEAKQIAMTQHEMCHMLAENIMRSINNTVAYYCEQPKWESFTKDLQSLKDRAHADWHSKQHQ